MIAMFTQEHLRAYREAAGWAAQFEFILRATAETLWDRGSSRDLKEMLRDIVDELQPHMTVEQLADLEAVNLTDLRHDILHSRMSKAFGKLGGKGNDPSVAGVVRVGKDDSGAVSGEHVYQALLGAMRGEAVPIAKTSTTTSGVAIWLTQMAVNGFFVCAAEAFERGCKILCSALGKWELLQLEA